MGEKAKVAAAAADEVINACRHPNGGWLRIVSAVGACRPREQAVSWNLAGLQARRARPAPRAEGRFGCRADEARRPRRDRMHQ